MSTVGGARAQDLQATAAYPKVFVPSKATAAETGETVAPAIRPLVASQGGYLVPGAFPAAKRPAGLPKVFVPAQPRTVEPRFPWRPDIVATVFWIGELPSANNPVPNTVSAWDRRWTSNYGGYDNPDPNGREGFLPREFTPGQNPFYFALPYNDISKTGTKASAKERVPWFEDAFYRDGRTVLKGRWIAIRRGDKVCYAQWEDVGPFETDDWEYVFGDKRPKTKKNRGAGLDVSPAVRDYLDFGGGYGTVDWRFVDIEEVPEGPWKQWGMNNPFVNETLTSSDSPATGTILRVRELEERLLSALDRGELRD
ncbi:MAG TPA: hypothetical protein PLA50_10665 [Bacteroidia bacterium]|nr:hypothetical protein [Bacteroidia bacterium]